MRKIGKIALSILLFAVQITILYSLNHNVFAQDITDLNEISEPFSPVLVPPTLVDREEVKELALFDIQPEKKLAINLTSGLSTEYTSNAQSRSDGDSDAIISPNIGLRGIYNLDTGKLVAGIGASTADYLDESDLDLGILQAIFGYSTTTNQFEIGSLVEVRILYSGTFDDRAITFYSISGSATRGLYSKENDEDGFQSLSFSGKLDVKYSFSDPDDFENINIKLSTPLKVQYRNGLVFKLSPSIYYINYDDFFDQSRNDYGLTANASAEWSIADNATLALGLGAKLQSSDDDDRDYVAATVPASLKFSLIW